MIVTPPRRFRSRLPFSRPVRSQVPDQAKRQGESETVIQQMSLRLHADQLPTPCPDLLSRVRVLEPQHVRYQGGVPQQQNFGNFPTDCVV
jgi:hypothetical protein